jgi:opacity protein-like surface antigen
LTTLSKGEEKSMKKIFTGILLAVLLMGVALPASAANNLVTTYDLDCCTAYGGQADIETSDDASNVYVSTEVPLNNQLYVKVTIQRYNYGWYDVETKNGGQAYYSWSGKKDVHLQFNGYSYQGRGIRAKVQLYSYSNYTGLVTTVYTKNWIR